jgi:hypothetical protein
MKPIVLIPLIVLFAAGLGAGVVQTRERAQLQTQIEKLRRQPAEAVEPLRRQLEETTHALTAAQLEHAQLQRAIAELPALRGELTRLKKDADEFAALKAAADEMGTAVEDWRLPILNQLRSGLEQRPEGKIPELQLLSKLDWLGIAQSDQIKVGSEPELRESLSLVRATAKYQFERLLRNALAGYTNSSGGQLPSSLSQLQPFFAKPVDDAILRRYEIVRTGSASDLRSGDLWVTEKGPAESRVGRNSALTDARRNR